MDNGQWTMDNAECPLCHTPLRSDDLDGHGDTVSEDGRGIVNHRACLLRLVAGSVWHQSRQCTCYGGTHEHEDGRPFREQAIAAWKYYIEHTSVGLGPAPEEDIHEATN